MPDTISYTTEAGAQTLTLNNPFNFVRDVLRKDLSTVHVPFSNVSFQRDRGRVETNDSANGLETFGTAAAADAFRDQVEELQGLECVIDHDNLSASETTTAFAGRSQARVDTNIFPGYHVIWSIPFSQYV